MNKTVFYIAYYSVGLLLVAWPLGLLGAAFLFDAPFRGTPDVVARFVTLGAVLIFPILYLTAWERGKQALKEDYSLLSILSPLIVPLLSQLGSLYFLR